MVEPTETESMETLDSFIGAKRQIVSEIETDPSILLSAPHETVMRKLDEATALLGALRDGKLTDQLSGSTNETNPQ